MSGYWADRTSRRSKPRPKGWKATRQRILARDNGQCQQIISDDGTRCLQPARNVDHIIPAHLHDNDNDSNLQLLCDPHERSKTSSEAGKAAAAKRIPSKRPAERHPGLL